MSNKITRFCIHCYCLLIAFLALISYLSLKGELDLSLSDRFLEKCRNNYYLSHILIKDHEYKFEDVLGCNNDIKNFSCSYSVKNSGQNDFYKKTGKIDDKSLNFLNELREREIFFVQSPSIIFSDKPAIKAMLNNTNFSINKVWFKLDRFYFEEKNGDYSPATKISLITATNGENKCDHIITNIIKKI